MSPGSVICPKCSKLHADTFTSCPHCSSGIGAGCGGILALVFTIAVVIFFVKACSDADEKTVRDQAAAAQQQEALDKSEAAGMGLSLDDYRKAKWAVEDAYGPCQAAAESQAKYNYKTDWTPNVHWTVEGDELTLVGHDIQMQNGFGVFSHVSYTCIWDMKMKAVVSVDVSED